MDCNCGCYESELNKRLNKIISMVEDQKIFNGKNNADICKSAEEDIERLKYD